MRMPDEAAWNGGTAMIYPDKTRPDETRTDRVAETYHLEVDATGEGDRLDRWLARQVSLSRSRLQSLIEEGQVTLNGQPATKRQTLQPGDRILVEVPPAQPLALEPEAIPLDILYEDDALIIINKPAGMVVHPAPGHPSGTLVNALLAHCPDLQGIGGVERPGIVHRLDKDTTGAIVVAKTEPAMHHLQGQIQAKTARREYLAVVHGAPSDTEGSVCAPIGRHPGDRQRMAVVPLEKGRYALTHWQVKERLGPYSLMQFRLDTGRTHQIRVHSAHIGHPVVGDPVYSSGRLPGVNLPGQALHAYRLSLIHPLTGVAVEATAPLPQTLTKLLNVLRSRLP
ncbi:MAG: RluA family pseudouridine synthase [Cyanobacteria bacterium P01_A01_bin.135]